MPVSGSGGGGAIEIAAIGFVRIDAEISARGGEAESPDIPSQVIGSAGPGGGGGIRVSGQQVILNAGLIASGGENLTPDSTNVGGGGRIFVVNRTDELPLFTVGQDQVQDTGWLQNLNALAGIDSSDSAANGLITLTPAITLVPAGESIGLGGVTQSFVLPNPDTGSPQRVNFFYTDVRVLAGGTVDIGSGTTNRYEVELDGPSASILGSGTLANDGVIRGTGRVEVQVINQSAGQIQTLDDTLTFTQPVTNEAGGQINSIGSTLTFPGDGQPTSGGGDNADGLTNNGNLNLISSTINGDVHSPTGSTISVGEGVVFEGLVSGGGNFPGAGGVTFNGGYAPGDSPAHVTLAGDLTLGNTNTLYIELGGVFAGTEYDQVAVAGFATLEGTLDVTLIDGFVPEVGDNFGFLMASGGFDNNLSTLNLPDLSALGLDWELNPGGATLFLEVVAALAGDFEGDNDVDGADFLAWQRDPGAGNLADWQANYGTTTGLLATSSTAIPEPNSLLLIAMSSVCGMAICRRR